MKHEEKQVPDLRFPEFADDWLKVNLADVSRFSKGKGIAKEDTSEEGTLECIRYGELYTRYGETISQVFSRTNLAPSELTFSKKGDVIIPSSGETNLDIATASCVLREGVALGGDITIIRSKLNGVFLAYYLNSAKRYEIARLAQGVSVVHLYPSHLGALMLRVPSSPEQVTIAAFLSAVNEKIGQLSRKKELLTQYKKGVMQQIFDQRIRFKDDNGNNFPDWEEKKLSEVARINPKTGPLPKAFTYIDLESVEDGSLNKESFIKAEVAPSRAQRVLKKGDILFQVVRPYQKNNFLFNQDGDFVASTGYAQIRARIDNGFLFQALLTFGFVKDVVRRCTGTSYPAINSDDLSKIVLKIPSNPEQQKIAAFLTAIDKKVGLVNTQLEQSKTFKKGLLQQMFV